MRHPYGLNRGGDSPPWHRLAYGDWWWALRDPLDLARLAFIAGTIAFAVSARSTAVGLTAASALLLICRIIDLPRRFDAAVIAAMTLIAWGTALGLYGQYYFYDNIVHGVAAFFYAPVLYLVLVRLGVLVDPQRTSIPRHHAGVFISTLALGMAVGGGYEVIEWLSDSLVGTHFVKSVNDTGSDLLEDTLGSCAGAVLVTVWSIRSWSTRRTAIRTGQPKHNVNRWIVLRVRELLRSRVDAPAFRWTARLRALPLALSGVIALTAGVVTLAWHSPALRTIEVVFGLAMLAQAWLDLPAAVRTLHRDRRRAGGFAVVLVETGVGITVLAAPGISRLGLAYIVGGSAVVFALFEAAALSTPGGTERARWLAGVGVVFAFVFGVAILAHPHHSLDALVVALGLYLVGLGAVRLVGAAEKRRVQRESMVHVGEGKIDDEWEVIRAAAGTEASAADGETVAHQAVVERDTQQRRPRRPAVHRPRALEDVVQSSRLGEVSELRGPRNRIEVTANDEPRAKPPPRRR